MASCVGSDTLENLLDYVFGATAYTPYATVHAALFTSAPSDYLFDVDGTPAAVARLAIANNSSNFPGATTVGSATKKTIAIGLNFGTAGSALTIEAIGLYSAATGGEWLGGGSLSTPMIVASGAVISLPANSIAIGLNTDAAGGCSGYLCRKMLDLSFGNVSYTPPATIYGAYYTTAPDYAAGTGGVEPSGGGYSRASVDNSIDNFSSAGFLSGSVKKRVFNGITGVPVSFPNPTGSQGVIVAAGFLDASSGGNLLWGGNLQTNRTIESGSANIRFVNDSIELMAREIA